MLISALILSGTFLISMILIAKDEKHKETKDIIINNNITMPENKNQMKEYDDSELKDFIKKVVDEANEENIREMIKEMRIRELINK